ncbi:hypothetical protein M2322_001981 [Rhodoblastus acidophilus]|uniref:hypothetical protein n=1 Tax=Rhodoblastus acidophilus TaxID=1074 RepID=UPI0022255073|nr:hypothetical protein [Rhodoblastus acidophilus]MCW2316433.1 hypothetical protein [Rhodoblastus acidophilus]
MTTLPPVFAISDTAYVLRLPAERAGNALNLAEFPQRSRRFGADRLKSRLSRLSRPSRIVPMETSVDAPGRAHLFHGLMSINPMIVLRQ